MGRERGDVLLPRSKFPESDDDVCTGDTPHCLPAPLHRVLASVLDDPVLRDEAIAHPPKTDEEGEEHTDGRVHKDRVEWVGKGGRVRLEREVDREAVR